MKNQKTKTENELIHSLTESSGAIANAMILSMIVGMAIVVIAK